MSQVRSVLLDILIRRTGIMVKESIGIMKEISSLDDGKTMNQVKESCISCNLMALTPNY
jgi:hypothetical protein